MKQSPLRPCYLDVRARGAPASCSLALRENASSLARSDHQVDGVRFPAGPLGHFRGLVLPKPSTNQGRERSISDTQSLTAESPPRYVSRKRPRATQVDDERTSIFFPVPGYSPGKTAWIKRERKRKREGQKEGTKRDLRLAGEDRSRRASTRNKSRRSPPPRRL